MGKSHQDLRMDKWSTSEPFCLNACHLTEFLFFALIIFQLTMTRNAQPTEDYPNRSGGVSFTPSLREFIASPLFTTSLPGLDPSAANRLAPEPLPSDLPPLVPRTRGGQPSSIRTMNMTSRSNNGTPRRSARIAASMASVSMPSRSTTSLSPSRKRSRSPKSPRSCKKKNAPGEKDLEKKLPAVEADCTCTICMCPPEKGEVSEIDGCNHLYCFSCIAEWAEHQNTCPLCKARFNRISRRGRKRGGTKKVGTRNQRSDIIPGAALENILASIASSSLGAGRAGTLNRVILHSRWGRGPFGAPAPFATFDDDLANGPALLSMHPAFLNLRAGNPRSDFLPPALSNPLLGTQTVNASTRSYATNANDSSAGEAANPLEIVDDSSDEEGFDDEVELVGVSHHSS